MLGLLFCGLGLGGGYWAYWEFVTKGQLPEPPKPTPVDPDNPDPGGDPAWNQVFQDPAGGGSGEAGTGDQGGIPPVPGEAPVEESELMRPRQFASKGPTDVLQDPLSNTILDVEFTPDGRVLAVFDAAGLATLWDLKTRRGVDVSFEHLGGSADSSNGRHLAISPDGKSLVYGTTRRMTVVDLPAARLRWKKGGVTQGNPLCVSHSVKFVAVFDEDPDGNPLSTVSVCEVASGKTLFQIETDASPNSDLPLVFSPDDKLAAWIDGVKESIRLYEIPSGKEAGSITGVPGAYSISFVGGSSQLLIPYVNDDLQIWDLTRPDRPKLVYKRFFPVRGTEMLYSPDTKTLATIPFLWDIDSRSDRAEIAGNFNNAAYSADSRRIACWGEQVTVADAATGKELTVLDPGRFDEYSARSVSCAAFSPDGGTVAIGTHQGQVVVRTVSASAPTSGRVASGTPGNGPQPDVSLEFKQPANLRDFFNSNPQRFADLVWLDPKGKWLVTSGHYATVWDLEQGRQVMVLSVNDGHGRRINSPPIAPGPFGDSSSVYALVNVHGWLFKDDGKSVVVAGGNGSLVHYDVEAGTHLFDGNDPGCEAIKLSPNGSVAAAWIVPGSRTSTNPKWELVILDGNTGEVRKSLGTYLGQRVRPFAYPPYFNTAFSADGRRLAALAFDNPSSGDPRLLIWDWESGQEHFVTEPTLQIRRLEIVSNGATLLVVTGESGSSSSGPNPYAFTSYDIELGSKGERVLLDRGHSGRITSLSFDLSQPRFVTGDEHGIVLLRDLQTGDPLVRFQAHSASVTAAFLSPDGRLVTAAKDGTVKVWNVSELAMQQ